MEITWEYHQYWEYIRIYREYIGNTWEYCPYIGNIGNTINMTQTNRTEIAICVGSTGQPITETSCAFRRCWWHKTAGVVWPSTQSYGRHIPGAKQPSNDMEVFTSLISLTLTSVYVHTMRCRTNESYHISAHKNTDWVYTHSTWITWVHVHLAHIWVHTIKLIPTPECSKQKPAWFSNQEILQFGWNYVQLLTWI